MNPEIPESTEKALLKIQPKVGLAQAPDESSPALAEIISRSLVHIQTSKAHGIRYRIGEHELFGPDYQLVCAWGEELRLGSEEILDRLLLQPTYESYTSICDGRFKTLSIHGESLPISGFPNIEGLVVERLSLNKVRSSNRKIANVSIFPNLNYFFCLNCQLAELELFLVPQLSTLECPMNHLTTLDLSRVPKLRKLSCMNNYLHELDLAVVFNLEILHCGNNDLWELDIRPLKGLRYLEFYHSHDVRLVQRPDQDFTMWKPTPSLLPTQNFK